MGGLADRVESLVAKVQGSFCIVDNFVGVLALDVETSLTQVGRVGNRQFVGRRIDIFFGLVGAPVETAPFEDL